LSDASQIRVMIADGHPIMREGLKEVLSRAGDLDVVGEAGDGESAVEMAARTRPDVIIMEAMMPVKDGIMACREIKGMLPGTRVMMLTASEDEDTVLRAVASGATGYLQKYCTGQKLVSTLRDVIEGELRVPAEALVRMAANARDRPSHSEAEQLPGLTAREKEILGLFSQGMTYAEIADAIGYRPLSVRNVIYGIQNKLKVKSKQELVVHAVRGGLLDA
jgi:two-component system NarL family response regulator